MLKKIIEAWKAKDLLVEIFDNFQNMLIETENMFRMIHKVMYEGEDPETLREQIYRTDIFVNKAERKVRKQIVEHLAIRPEVDMPACLILMSVVKDAERLGDYCKNLIEAHNIEGGLSPDDPYKAEFDAIHNRIAQEFVDTREAISEHSEELGKKVIFDQVELGKKCDELIRRLAEDNLETRKAVGHTLITRHYKRISSHLANIATSVVVPLHKIDYYYEKDEKNQKRYIK